MSKQNLIKWFTAFFQTVQDIAPDAYALIEEDADRIIRKLREYDGNKRDEGVGDHTICEKREETSEGAG